MLVEQPRGDDVADQVDAEERLEGDFGGPGEGALDDAPDLVADLHVLPEALARPLFRSVVLLEALDVLGGPGRELVLLLVLAGLPGLVAVGAHVGVAALADLGPRLVEIDGLVGLVDRAPGRERALLLDDVLQVALRGDPVAGEDRAPPLVVRPRPDRVDAREPLGKPGRSGRAQRVETAQDDTRALQALPGGVLFAVLGVGVDRAQVADRMGQMPAGVAIDLGPPRLAPGERMADALAQLCDGLVGDLAVLVRHVSTPSAHPAPGPSPPGTARTNHPPAPRVHERGSGTRGAAPAQDAPRPGPDRGRRVRTCIAPPSR